MDAANIVERANDRGHGRIATSSSCDRFDGSSAILLPSNPRQLLLFFDPAGAHHEFVEEPDRYT
ncbi:hypothetical protein [Caballeronia hypogeia]|uniref:hypothetical protein n=1 Tax=Caballeronia hypogeia TaxID=1777140 RepID=UPI00077226EB|nr:hypothetical protein [Caballeronia hypogeia]